MKPEEKNREKKEIFFRKFFRKKGSLQIFLTMVLLIFGMMIPTMIRKESERLQAYSSAKAKAADYANWILTLEEEQSRLKDAEKQLSEEKTSLGEAILAEHGFSSFAEDLQKAKALSGLSQLEGKGVVVTLDDATITNPDDVNQVSLIHAEDVIYLLNILNSSGVEGLAINEERVVGTSGIVCNGPKIRINNARYPVPFVIFAVCDDPESMIKVLQEDSYIKARITAGVRISFSTEENIILPEYRYLGSVEALYKLVKGE